MFVRPEFGYKEYRLGQFYRNDDDLGDCANVKIRQASAGASVGSGYRLQSRWLRFGCQILRRVLLF